ncbi:hypothetical protein yaldo0001_29450 [Yersinia aldovae ATCC 35236]|nr:hypothetical protein yaldo0001_29450 [Yersinia aldovae ATCC 35236]
MLELNESITNSNEKSVVLDIKFRLWRTKKNNQATLWKNHHRLSLD